MSGTQMVLSVSPHPVKLAIVKVVHTIIYIVMAAGTIYVFVAGVSGRRDRMLVLAVTLVALEGVVFFANGMRCPLTQLAQRYGDPRGHVGDTLFPEKCTRYTFRAFGSLYGFGLMLIGVSALLG